MECNKEEAVRVTDIAELKFAKNDLAGAKRFVLKALKLYPCLGGAMQLSAILDVHIAAQVEVGINEPDPDYYGILQVKPLSDASTIKQQYRNLSKLVHPNKNKESMKEKSEAAFKLIAKAFEVLSDEGTRFQHDSKRGEKPTAKEPPKPTYPTHQPQQRDAQRGGTPRANPQPHPESWKQEQPNATYSANQPRHARPPPAPGAQASQAPNAFGARPPPPPGAQASQAPNAFRARPPPPPGAQASQAPNAFGARPTPPPGAQAYQAPNAFGARPPPPPGAQASEAPNAFGARPPPPPGAQAYQAPNAFGARPTPPLGAQASQAPNAFGAQPTQAPGAQASQAPYTFWTACPICRMQYQCMRIFLNYQVVCQNCHSSFPANDINVHPANGASAFVWPSGPLGNNNPFPPANGAFVWPSGASGNNNPFPAGTNWYEMFQNYLAPPYGASTNGTSGNDFLAFLSGANPYGDYGAFTNGTSGNDLLAFLSGANPYGDYGAFTNGTSWSNLLSMFSGGNPFGDSGNNSSATQFCLSMLLSAMNLS